MRLVFADWRLSLVMKEMKMEVLEKKITVIEDIMTSAATFGEAETLYSPPPWALPVKEIKKLASVFFSLETQIHGILIVFR